LYQSQDGLGYIESAKINRQGRIKELKPASKTLIANLLANVDKEEKMTSFGGYIADNLLYCQKGKSDSFKLIWHTEPQKRNLLFKKETQISDGERWIPGLIWIGTHTDLRIYAYREFKGLQTNLYQAPFFNVNESGWVCLGSASNYFKKSILPLKDINKIIQAFEYMFFNSVFTHANVDNLIDGNLSLYMQELLNTNVRFDPKKLISVKQKFDSLCQS
jgi:PRTRC genetic system protein B